MVGDGIGTFILMMILAWACNRRAKNHDKEKTLNQVGCMMEWK